MSGLSEPGRSFQGFQEAKGGHRQQSDHRQPGEAMDQVGRDARCQGGLHVEDMLQIGEHPPERPAVADRQEVVDIADGPGYDLPWISARLVHKDVHPGALVPLEPHTQKRGSHQHRSRRGEQPSRNATAFPRPSVAHRRHVTDPHPEQAPARERASQARRPPL